MRLNQTIDGQFLTCWILDIFFCAIEKLETEITLQYFTLKIFVFFLPDAYLAFAGSATYKALDALILLFVDSRMQTCGEEKGLSFGCPPVFEAIYLQSVLRILR